MSRTYPLVCAALTLLLTIWFPFSAAADSLSRTQQRNGDEVSVRFGGPGALDIDAVVKIGLERNGEVVAMRLELEAAREKARQARLLANPMLEIRRDRSTDGMDREVMVEGSMPLEITGKRGARIKAAVVELELKEIAVRTRERDLAVETRKAFSALVAAHLKSELVGRMVSTAESALRLTETSVAAGKVSPLSASMQAVELNKLRSMAEKVKAEETAAAIALKTLVGVGAVDPFAIKPDLSVDRSLLLNRDEALVLGLQRSLELQGARLVESLAAARLALARAEGRPGVEVAGAYRSGRSSFPLYGMSQSGLLGPIEKEMRMFSFGLKISLPVFDRNQGEVGAARADLDAARQRLAFGEIAVRGGILTAGSNFEQALKASEITGVGVVGQAGKNLEVLRESYALGAISLTELLAEQRAVLEAEMQYVDSQRELFDAQTEYLKAVGSDRLLGR